MKIATASRLAVAILTALALPACAIRPEVPPREAAQLVLGSRDQGCSHVPDVAHGLPCLRHDSSYWAGGTERDRFIADAELLRDLALWGVPEPIAVVYYLGVRWFGWCCWEYGGWRTRGPDDGISRPSKESSTPAQRSIHSETAP